MPDISYTVTLMKWDGDDMVDRIVLDRYGILQELLDDLESSIDAHEWERQEDENDE